MCDINVCVYNYSEQGKEIYHDDVKNLKFSDDLKKYKVMYIFQEQKELLIYVVNVKEVK